LKYTVVLSRQAEHYYKRLEKKTKAQVRENLLLLEDDPYVGKRLHGDLKEHYSLRIGKLRIIYTVLERDKLVQIVAMGLRKTIYG
jgi:mRNA-degrading endonuclease RelE of RelBE toxin-antitoxin system